MPSPSSHSIKGSLFEHHRHCFTRRFPLFNRPLPTSTPPHLRHGERLGDDFAGHESHQCQPNGGPRDHLITAVLGSHLRRESCNDFNDDQSDDDTFNDCHMRARTGRGADERVEHEVER